MSGQQTKQNMEKSRLGLWFLSVGLWSKQNLISSFLSPPRLWKSHESKATWRNSSTREKNGLNLLVIKLKKLTCMPYKFSYNPRNLQVKLQEKMTSEFALNTTHKRKKHTHTWCCLWLTFFGISAHYQATLSVFKWHFSVLLQSN